MPDPVTLGHVLMICAALVLLYALWQLSVMVSNRSFGRGTPQYARARDGRRFAAWAVIAAAILLVLGYFTPLAAIALT